MTPTRCCLHGVSHTPSQRSLEIFSSSCPCGDPPHLLPTATPASSSALVSGNGHCALSLLPGPANGWVPWGCHKGSSTNIATCGSSWSTIHTGAEDSHLSNCCVYFFRWKYTVSFCGGLEVYARGGWGCMVHVAMCVLRTIHSRKGCQMSCSVTVHLIPLRQCLSLKPGTRLASKPLKSCCLFHTLTPMAQGLEMSP